MNKDLNRFIEAQATTFEIALSQIQAGKKTSHWIWYIFPQIKGMGISITSKFYAIEDVTEAINYLKHPILGDRLKQITNELLNLKETNILTIFDTLDSLKVQSCMTLFASIDPSEDNIFKKVLNKFYNGELHDITINKISN